jgi:GDPmannose 4,6-dehydratase
VTAVNSAGGTALITGVTGQDGYYLSELLIRQGLSVHGVLRPGARTDGLLPQVSAHHAELTSVESLGAILESVQPDLVFHLAGISSVAASWQDPVAVTRVNALSTAALLDACLRAQEHSGKEVAVVNASSCEIFAGAPESPQTEATALRPMSPYGASKAFGHNLCQVYRAKGLKTSNAILYNHESPRRPEKFVTRKITKAVADIAAGRRDRLVLGDMTVRRDWGWAPDYADAMYRMAMLDSSDDFVVATGVAHSISDFVAAAFAAAGIADPATYVETDAALLRPAEGTAMIGDSAKARRILGWQATRSFEQIVDAMVTSDLRQEQNA